MFARTGLFMVSLILATMLAACGSDDSEIAGVVGNTSSPVYDLDFDEGDEAESLAAEDAEYAPGQVRSSFDRRVIRSGELELLVSDINVATRQARDIVTDRGGHVASSSTQLLSNDRERADISFEVPEDVFETVMNELRDGSWVVNVEHESTSTQDVSEEYVDLQSRLTNLSATEARFVQLLDDAQTISDVLSIENEISRIRGEIERIQGRINYLDQRTSFSRIHVIFELAEDDAMTVAGHHFAPGESAREAWNASMRFIGTVGNALITVVVFFWWAWPLLALAALGLFHLRRRRTVATV